MESLDYCYWALGITAVYLTFLLMQKRYRLLLPSIIHTFIWLITILLIIFQLKGLFVSNQVSNNVFNFSSEFICILMLTSVIGFTMAHIATARAETKLKVQLIDIETIDRILGKFKWIPYFCGIIGILLFIFLIVTIGNIDSFSDYRILALSTERVGYAAIAQRISGHINILGNFYLMLLGYKYGQTGIDIRGFFKYVLLCSFINISIGGRVWILTSTLPFLVTFFFSRKYSSLDVGLRKKDIMHITVIVLIFSSLFSVIAQLRNKSDNHGTYMDKFLYLTDGSRMTNMVLEQYPEDCYNYEYGKSTLAQAFILSPMSQKFSKSISHDLGLSVTVKSIMPYLYYDFGFCGGALFWGLLCFFIEYVCIRLKYNCTVIGILLFGQLSFLLFQSPVGHIFAVYTPVFEWLIILYVFRKKLFRDCLDTKFE